MTAPTQSTQQPQDQDPEWAPIPRAHAQYQRRPSATSPTDGQGKANDGKTGQGKEGDEEGEDEDEEEDEYEKRIERTGCAAENEALQMCYAEKHDWRACQTEMIAFRECWKRNGNIEAEK